MMRNFTPWFVLAILLTLFSCKKEDSENNENGSNEAVSIDDEENLVKAFDEAKEKPPRAEKINNEFVLDDVVYESSDAAFNNLDENNQEKYELLVLGGNTSQAKIFQQGNAYGWILNSENGATPENSRIYIFTTDGSYLVFDESAGNWQWGYWYIDNAFENILFDYGTSVQQKWALDSINATMLNVTENSVSLAFDPYVLSGVKNPNTAEAENDTSSSATTLVDIINNNTFYMQEDYYYEDESTTSYPFIKKCSNDTTVTYSETFYYTFNNDLSGETGPHITENGCSSEITTNDTLATTWVEKSNNRIDVVESDGYTETWELLEWNPNSGVLVINRYLADTILTSRDTYYTIVAN